MIRTCSLLFQSVGNTIFRNINFFTKLVVVVTAQVCKPLRKAAIICRRRR